jgi:hypothetical protein
MILPLLIEKEAVIEKEALIFSWIYTPLPSGEF